MAISACKVRVQEHATPKQNETVAATTADTVSEPVVVVNEQVQPSGKKQTFLGIGSTGWWVVFGIFCFIGIVSLFLVIMGEEPSDDMDFIPPFVTAPIVWLIVSALMIWACVSIQINYFENLKT